MIRHLGAADYRAMPWANGRGTTTELARENRPDGGLSWRLSVATVSEDGSFSPLHGIDRILTLISGKGFDLMIDGARHALAPLSPLAFSGDAAVSAVGVKGPSLDFNVMVDRRDWQASVTLITSPHRFRVEGGDLAFLYMLDEGAGKATAGDLIVIQDEDVFTFAEGEAALLVCLTPRNA